MDDFSCRYGSGSPLRLLHVSFEVRPGEFVAIIGPSGGGKSSLAYAINGILPHEIEGSETAGAVTVRGLPVAEHPPHELVHAVGTVLQDPEWQLVTFSVGDEIAFGLENLGVEPGELTGRVAGAARSTGLTELLDRSPDLLSGGQKQRVAIASCLALQPAILLLDEPTAELDPAGKATVLETVARLNREHGVTVLFIDHNLDLLAPYADRVLLLAGGELAAQGSPREILADPAELAAAGLLPPACVAIAKALPPTLQPDEPPLSVAELAATLTGHLVPAAAPVGEATRATPGRTVLEAEEVWFAYPGHPPAVRGVDLSLREGEYVGLIGANGAGKSTLARLLCGLLRPGRGAVQVGGRPLAAMTRMEVAAGVGCVFQNPDLQFFTQRCYDEIAFGLRLQGRPEADIRRRVTALAEQLGIAGYLDEHPHFLSRGERRRVALASVLALEPRTVILDEPTTGLDTGTAARMLEIVGDLHRRGHTILLLTHDMAAVLAHCTRAILVHEGRIALDDDPRRAFLERSLLESCAIRLPPVAEFVHALPWPLPALLPRTAVEAARYVACSLGMGGDAA